MQDGSVAEQAPAVGLQEPLAAAEVTNVRFGVLNRRGPASTHWDKRPAKPFPSCWRPPIQTGPFKSLQPVRPPVAAGVASQFLEILRGDQRGARKRVTVLAVVALLLCLPAWYLWQPWQGIAVHAGAVAVGIGAGLLVGRAMVQRYEASIRGTWTQWMRYAVAAESVAEIHRKVRGRRGRNLPYLYAGLLTFIWGVEATLLVLGLTTSASQPALAAPFIAATGLLTGGILGYNVVLHSWYGSFRSSVAELVDSGEIGLWGVM